MSYNRLGFPGQSLTHFIETGTHTNVANPSYYFSSFVYSGCNTTWQKEQQAKSTP